MRARHYLSFSGNVFKNMNWDEVSTKVATSDEHYLKKLQKTIVKNIDDLFPCDSLLEQIKLLCLYSKPDEQLLKPFKRVFNFENECFILHEKLPPFTFVYSSTKTKKVFQISETNEEIFFEGKTYKKQSNNHFVSENNDFLHFDEDSIKSGKCISSWKNKVSYPLSDWFEPGEETKMISFNDNLYKFEMSASFGAFERIYYYYSTSNCLKVVKQHADTLYFEYED